jgi:hypothetical protein
MWGVDSDPDAEDDRTEAEAVAACWAHYDRAFEQGTKCGVEFMVDAFMGRPVLGEIAEEYNREQQALGIERAADELAPEYDDYSFVTRRLRELAAKVRRGDA